MSLLVLSEAEPNLEQGQQGIKYREDNLKDRIPSVPGGKIKRTTEGRTRRKTMRSGRYQCITPLVSFVTGPIRI